MGAAEFMNSIQNIFNWQCLCENIDSKDIDKLVDIYINDKDMLQWFKKNNKFALEEISRRFLKLHERGKWSGREDVLNSLKRKLYKYRRRYGRDDGKKTKIPLEKFKAEPLKF